MAYALNHTEGLKKTNQQTKKTHVPTLRPGLDYSPLCVRFTCCLSKWSLSAPRWCSVLLLFTLVLMFILQPARRRVLQGKLAVSPLLSEPSFEAQSVGVSSPVHRQSQGHLRPAASFTADAPRRRKAGKSKRQGAFFITWTDPPTKGGGESPSSSSSCPLASTSTYRQVVFPGCSQISFYLLSKLL